MTDFLPELDDRQIVFASVCGMMRFDAQRVADAVRNGRLSKLELESLARLIEGSNSQGLKLVMQGQGRNWKPILEKAGEYQRVLEIGRYVNQQMSEGANQEDAVFDACECFSLSPSTIYRTL